MTAPAAIATAAATPMAVPEKMHVEVAGFAGFGEFHGSTVDCSADAELMARHPLDGSPLDAATLNAWWRDYLLTGHGDAHGARLSGIYWHLTASAHKLDPGKARVAAYIPTDSATLDALHDNLKAALARGQTVIVYLGNAQALPYNERNVHGHFVAIGGIDSDQGYLVGNGDDVNALGGKNVIGARWYGWNQLAAAQINGMIALAKVGTGSATGGSTVTTTEPTPTVQSEYQEILALRKEIYSLKDQLTAAHTQVDQQYQEILALRKQIGDLKGQLAHPPTPPTSTPPTPVPDPKAVAALAAITELAKALKLAGGQAA
ncbi:MAG TPA: hypothetical protein VFU63_05825 [Ktedonobacterales bacterium]|nr:hypothetical protein [Ktedonobacterales bacterium]